MGYDFYWFILEVSAASLQVAELDTLAEGTLVKPLRHTHVSVLHSASSCRKGLTKKRTAHRVDWIEPGQDT